MSHPRPSTRLPADEHRYLQNRYTIESHFRGGAKDSSRFSAASSSSTNSSSTPSSKYSLSAEQRLRASEIRYATRKALGESFDFTEESFVSLDANRSPQYLNNASGISADEYYESCQTSSYKPKPAFRKSSGKSKGVSETLQCDYQYRQDSGYASRSQNQYNSPVPEDSRGRSPELKSKFSWDSSDDEKPKKSSDTKRLSKRRRR